MQDRDHQLHRRLVVLADEPVDADLLGREDLEVLPPAVRLLLAEHIRALTNRIERSSKVRRKIPLAFIGSVISGENILTTILKHRITFSLPQISVVQPMEAPAFGAVLLACQSAATPQSNL